MSDVRLSFCHICEQTCGLAVSVEDGRITRIRPDKEHPYSWRDFCIKGARAHELVYDPRRITRPMRRVGDHLEIAAQGTITIVVFDYQANTSTPMPSAWRDHLIAYEPGQIQT